MAMQPGLSLKVSQNLALTPQLQQAIRLLQLSTLELDQEVQQMLCDNPFLETADTAAPREDFGLEQADTPPRVSEFATDLVAGAAVDTPLNDDFANESSASGEAVTSPEALDWEGDGTLDLTPDDGEWGGEAPARQKSDGASPDAQPLERSAHPSLQQHLHAQAAGLRLCPEEQAALRYLIESLNDDGYLEDTLSLHATLLAEGDPEATEALKQHFAVALRLLQSFDPTGVGARDLPECLKLQLQRLLAVHLDEHAAFAGGDDPGLLRLALRICDQPLELLARRDLRKLCTLCETGDEAAVRAAIALIGHLEPKPGRRFADVTHNLIVPDVIVSAVRGRGGTPAFRVQLNSDVLPRLRVQETYARALRGFKGQHAGELQQRLQEARWFIKNIQQRFDTILRVANAIVQQQKDFFIHGEIAMRPLVLREIADAIGMHESTISRVTTAKYMATPRGTFELKYFFGSGLDTDSGVGASSTAVRAIIRQLVAAEDPQKPLSDNQIADLLKDQGIECARRTVAKYRDALKIAPGNLRKAL